MQTNLKQKPLLIVSVALTSRTRTAARVAVAMAVVFVFRSYTQPLTLKTANCSAREGYLGFDMMRDYRAESERQHVYAQLLTRFNIIIQTSDVVGSCAKLAARSHLALVQGSGNLYGEEARRFLSAVTRMAVPVERMDCADESMTGLSSTPHSPKFARFQPQST